MAASCTLPPTITNWAEYSSQYEYFNSWQPRALYRGDSLSSVLTVGLSGLSRSPAGLSKDVKHLTLSPGGPGHMFPLVKV